MPISTSQRNARVRPILFMIAWSLSVISSAAVNLEELTFSSLRNNAGQGAAEILAIDAPSQTILVINPPLGHIDRFAFDEAALLSKSPTRGLTRLPSIELNQELRKQGLLGSGFSWTATSIDLWSEANLIAVSIAMESKTSEIAPTGYVLFYSLDQGAFIDAIEVGHHPDMIKFIDSKTRGLELLVANEGEPNPQGTYDGEGSISVISIENVRDSSLWRHTLIPLVDQATAIQSLIRLDARTKNPLKDLEPEYLSVTNDSQYAFISLQENNAIGVLNLATKRVETIFGLGVKHHDQPGQEVDVSVQDGGWQLKSWPIDSYFMPDAIAVFEHQTGIYLVSANEGDTRDWLGHEDTIKVSRIKCKPSNATSPPAWHGQRSEYHLGALEVDRLPIIDNSPACPERITAFGGRSISVWNPASGQLVWDSASDMSARVSRCLSADPMDRRSPKRGIEPEGLALAHIGDQTIAFVGLERGNAILAYDLTEPAHGQYAGGIYFQDGRHRGPEAMKFLPSERNANEGLLFASFEYTATIAVFHVSMRSTVGDKTDACW